VPHFSGNPKTLNPMPIEESSIRRACSLSDLHMGNFGKRKHPRLNIFVFTFKISNWLFLTTFYSRQIEWHTTEAAGSAPKWKCLAIGQQKEQFAGQNRTGCLQQLNERS